MTDTNVPARSSQPWLNDKTYGFLKFVAQILLPALGTLYAAVAGFWGLPAVQEVMGTIVAVDTFLGLVLGISTAQFNALRANAPHDGTLTVQRYDDNSGAVTIGLTTHPADIMEKKEVVLRVDASQEVTAATPGDLPQVPPV